VALHPPAIAVYRLLLLRFASPLTPSALRFRYVMLSVIRKRSFLSVPPALEGPSDIIRAEGAIIRQSSASKHSSEKLYREWEGGREPRCWKQRGSGSATFV
jgi:hypothetical protein